MATRKMNKMVADGKSVAVAKNGMRDALIVAHNAGNKRAISEEVALGAGVGSDDFNTWKLDVDKLRGVVWDYVVLKNKARCDSSVTDAKLKSARNLIFPQWKSVLSGGEKRCLEKTMHVDPVDVEDLIGFCWDFMATSEQGTIQVKMGKDVFRRKVESLVGVIMARNEILDDDDRDTLTLYYGYQRTILTQTNRITELDEQLKMYRRMKSENAKEKAFVAYIDGCIKTVEKEKAEAEKTKAEAEGKRSAIEAKAIAVEDRIKRI